MFKSPNWRETAELVGIFAILVSLVFVSMQLRHEEDLLSLELRIGMINTQATINQAIIENIEIWQKGNAGEELSTREQGIHRILIQNYNDWHFQTAHIFSEVIPGAEEQVLSIFAGFLVRNPGAYQVWLDREQMLNTQRTLIDPSETVTSHWISSIQSRMEILASGSNTELK